MGRRRPAHFTDPLAPELVDEWDAKSLAELVARTAFPGGTVTLAPGDDPVLWTVRVDDVPVGTVSRVALDAPVWAAPAYGVEITLASLSAAVTAPGDPAAALLPATTAAASRRLVPLAITPAAERDVTLVVPDELPAARVETVVRREGGELLERLELLREYRGSGVPAGARSLSWRLTLRHPERTLRDKEIDGRLQKLLRALEGELGVRPRA
jgi:phenylalanyl-tRNA synthetase beta chain